ncbi:MAG: 2-amino-4-hydroxy-6-hydroxymethyldihydropteridine diphosphokinase, partial [bacterium]
MIKDQHKAYLSIGSNLGDSLATARSAVDYLNASPEIEVIGVSSFYRTSPMGRTEQPDFINAAAKIITSLSPELLLSQCKHIELRLGRTPSDEIWSP